MPLENAVDPRKPGELQSRHPDRLIARLAERQHGAVSRRQLFAAGLTRHSIDGRVARGALHAVHRGVYAAGHPRLTQKGRWMAAVLAGGSEATLSHGSAACLLEIRFSTAITNDVTVWPGRRPRPGLRFHTARLPPDERTHVDGIPVTTAARTLLDVAAILDPHRLDRAIHEADVRRLHGPLSVAELIARHPRARGVADLRRLIEQRSAGESVTREELEHRFLALIDRRRLPRPRVNALIDAGASRRFEVDCHWPEHRLVAELDGYAVHGTRRNFESDRLRDRALVAAGWRTIRITWRQLHSEPAALARDLRTLLHGG